MNKTQGPQEDLKGAESRYEQLRLERDYFLDRARESSKLTIPSLVPPENHQSSNDLYKPFQSLGARGVNNLASKLLMALFPPNTPPFRWRFDDAALEDAAKANEGFKSQLDEALAKGERVVQTEIETSHIRTDAFETIKHLVIAGNCLVHKPKKGRMLVYHLSQYVVFRDVAGNPLEIILKEQVAPAALAPKYRKLVENKAATAPTDHSVEKTVSLFTWVRLIGKTWNIHQEVKGIIIQESIGHYPKDRCPWLALRWTKIQGENYGRGYIEELSGDLQSHEGLSQAIVQGSAAGAKVLFLVNPNGNTSIDDIAKKPNGGFAEGTEQDISVLQLNKFNDFRVALETINGIQSRLEKSFLLNSSVQRNGERVTAEEIRFLAGELETALGGVYAVLSQEFQLPLINILIENLQASKKLPKFPSDTIKPTIVTGLEALGRSNDLTKLDMFLSETAQLVANPTVEKYFHVDEVFRRRATALGIDAKGLVKTKEEIAQANQQAQQQAAMTAMGPQVIQQAGKVIDTQTKAASAPAQAA